MKKIILLTLVSFSAIAQINIAEIKIARDQYGVPHIFAPTDPQVAYGLAWANAEDDFKTMQLTMLAGKGQLAKLKGKDGAAVDYVAGLLRSKRIAKEKLTTLSPEFLDVVKGYVAGINKYAETHPKEVLVKNSFPLTVVEYISSNILSLSVISGIDGVLKSIISGKVEDPPLDLDLKGSNAFAIAGSKTKDGSAYLNINSHQPFEGQVAWYEAHVCSEQGWNTLGGLFPGGCVIFVGANENLGWGHTVNKPDKIDTYKLEINPANENQYKFDNQWLTLEQEKIKLKVKMGLFTIPVTKKAYWSVYGATMKTKKGTYSVRMAPNQDIRGIEQWYRMNKAKNFSEFYKAMEMVAIPGFNTIYADNNDTIYYVSNAKIPLRNPKYNWQKTLPGNTSKTLTTAFHPLKDLPQYLNPSSGYLYNTNNTPYNAAGEKDNLKAQDFDKTMGYETLENNRSMRFQELIPQFDKLSYEDFKSLKYDGQYPAKFYFPTDINVFSEFNSNEKPELKAEIELIKNWDRKTNIENHGAALFSIFIAKIAEKYGYNNFEKVLNKQEAYERLAEAKQYMITHFGSTNVPLGDVQKLVRGNKELPIWGMADVLTAMYCAEYKNGVRKGFVGDSYIQLVKFTKGKLPEIESVINYGASSHADSPHYIDQMQMFVDKKTKPMTLNKNEVLKNAKSVYSPQ
jgi:acyl-homoserine-lactone acylase